ncbi:MAG TPA: 5'/3'-nucleotidase SurE [Candidatus Eisenbacteria bacterium]|nr:5'/3'-nucleotidase SurE [Candidatus Eisenbacteria bacterium]
MKRILVSNDDGIDAPGLVALVDALSPLAEVSVMAPQTEQSATSHALTLQHPLRVRTLGPRRWSVNGTPTDCVLLALQEFLPEPPDLVISGINEGPNMGEDVIYSGTVAAAMEGAILGVPSLAVSLASRQLLDFTLAASVAARIAARLLDSSLHERFLINVNVPPGESIRGYRVTRLGTRVYHNAIIKNRDPRGREYYWIGGGEPSWGDSTESDFAAVSEGYVSLTPLLTDLTDLGRLPFLESLELS